MALQAGSRIGPYEILAQVGAGGMGEVYRARDSKLDRVVAVKVLPGGLASDPETLARFEREAKAVAALSHPNILAIFDFGTHDGHPFAAMELLEGESLRARLSGGPLPPRKSIEYALQVCHGLAAAHEKGIVHRDLKPDNLFLTKDNRIKILDFGLAKVTRPTPVREIETMDLTPPTEPGTVMGTVGYMSPEQVRGEEVDQRSDIFSFGAILYEMVSGRRAFKADTAVETMSAILKHDPPELEESNRNIDPALDRIVRHCLEKHREARFQSARDLAFQLETLSGVSTSMSGSRLAALPRGRRRRIRPAVALALILGAAVSGFVASRWLAPDRAPSYQQLTFQRGTISAARFAPDGKTIVYSAAWNGAPVEILSTLADSPESRPLGLPAGLLTVSSSGEMAIVLKCQFFSGACRGTLARAPLGGGAPRELQKDVSDADWTPDGKDLLMVRLQEGRYRLEYPPGKLLYEPAAAGSISHARFSPKGDAIAFIEHPSRGDDGGSVALVDLDGKRRVLSEGWGSVWGLAWHPSGKEIWFTAAETGRIQPLRAVSLSGKSRVVLQAPARLILQDISSAGDVLLARESARAGMMCLPPGETKEKDLSWFDWSTSAHLSPDGKSVVFCERGEGTRGAQTIYSRGTDGAAAVKLGEGRPLAVSPDGAWVAAVVGSGSTQKLTLLPTGAGSPRELPAGPVTRFHRVSWFPRSNRLLILGTEDRTRRCYVLNLDGGAPVAIGPEGQSVDFAGSAVSPDEALFAATGADGRISLHSLDAGAPRALSATIPGGVPIQWSPDGKFIYVSQRDSFPAKVHRVNVATGGAELWKEIQPADATGVVRIPSIEMGADGKSYVYNFNHRLSELYLAQGLQ